jgi:hypothetical protein
MSTVIETTAPIALEDLKKCFIEKDAVFLINYENSSLKGNKLLTYLGNLDIQCDVKLNFTTPDHLDLLKDYFQTNILLKIPSLEKAAILCLLEKKSLISNTGFDKFIKENFELLDQWESILDSLTLYNMQTVEIEEFKTFVESFPEDLSDSSRYVNFVNLLHHEEFFLYFSKIDPTKLKNYRTLFNNYCFRGKNLYIYWAVDVNPLFLLTWGLVSGNLDIDEYINATRHDYNLLAKGSENVSPV